MKQRERSQDTLQSTQSEILMGVTDGPSSVVGRTVFPKVSLSREDLPVLEDNMVKQGLTAGCVSVSD